MFKSTYRLTSVTWEITLTCNMKCMHCGSAVGQSRIDELTTKEALELCNQFNKLNVEIVNFTGGEPILRKDWFELGKKIKDFGIDLSLLSNGLALDEKTISLIRKLDVYTMGLSLDGGVAKTHDSIRGVIGSFQKCIKSLEYLKKEGIPTTVITTVHKENIKELTKIRDILLDRANAWQIQIAAPIGRFPKNLILSKEDYYSLALFIAAMRKKYNKKLAIIGAHSIGYHSKILRNTMLIPLWKGCQAGISTVGIQSNGDVKGCVSLPDDYVETNIRKRSLIDIWNDNDFASYTRHFKKENLKGNCKECKYGESCKGGCNTMSAALTNMLNCDPYCLYLLEKEILTG